MTYLYVRVHVVHGHLIVFFKHFASIHDFKTIGPVHENIGTNHASEQRRLRGESSLLLCTKYG